MGWLYSSSVEIAHKSITFYNIKSFAISVHYYFSKQICNTEPMFVSRKMEVKVIKSGMFYVSFLLYTMRLVEFSRLEIFVS